MSENGKTQYDQVPIQENYVERNAPKSYGYGIRHTQLLLATVSLTIAFLSRIHIGVTIVAMTDQPKYNDSYNIAYKIPYNNTIARIEDNNKTTTWEDVDYDNLTKYDDDYYFDNITALQANSTNVETNVNKKIMTYAWPKSKQEMILGSFFLGYSIMMFPMGLVAQRWGSKLPIQIALLISGLTTFFTPWLTSWGSWKAVCACRFVQGLSQAGFIPSIQIIITKWSSPSERARFISYAYSGPTLGTVLAFQLAGFLGTSSWGWPSTFWVIGGLSIIMFIVVSVFASPSPAEHRSISEEEKEHIMGGADQAVKKSVRVPWKAISKSKYVWAATATHIGSGLSYIFFYNQGPSYIHYILGVDIKKSGLLTSLPYLSNSIMNIVYGVLSDFLTNRKILSVVNARKFFNSLSQVGLALCYILVSFTKHVELAVVCFIFAVSLHAAVHCGFMLNHIDLSPNYSGTLMAAGNTIMTILSVLQPVIISQVITDVTNQYQWRIMFLLMASISLITNAIFVFFMTSETQPWNDFGYEETKTEDEREQNRTREQINSKM